MNITLINHSYKHETEALTRLFFPYEKITFTRQLKAGGGKSILTQIKDGAVFVKAEIDSQTAAEESPFNEYGEKYTLASALYRVLSKITGITPPWGTLYGVRPVHLYKNLRADYGDAGAARLFKDKYLVDKEKISLVRAVAENESKITALSAKNSFSLYVAIPFCPTRCSYCSFVSHSVEKAAGLVSRYVELLGREIRETANIAKRLGLRLECIYFGGGTPTALTTSQLQYLFSAIEQSFEVGTVREYTVEAGRPDTITCDKLLAMKAAGVTRISVNPQTFNDDVLAAIGRRHTARQTEEAFLLAQSLGFDNINMDFIAALTSDSPASFEKSIRRGIELGAPSITVHALAVKSGAYLAENFPAGSVLAGADAGQMISTSAMLLKSSGYIPYYMYRQSKAAGNLENVGWCRAGYEGIYNIFMIDETHTVLSVGAGGVTLLKNQNTSKIERVYNYKYPYEYIRSFDEIIKRKERIKDFYNEYSFDERKL
ncbi:MAG: coproporphyrinogen dehydrogenase HemZ [Clostridiales bacterium]|nr:coproporphyrinogen dehydrogenase HemZ [Clostridiales bacterium]